MKASIKKSRSRVVSLSPSEKKALKARRIREEINSKWEKLEKDFQYKRLSIRKMSRTTTESIEFDVLEDNTLVLNPRHMVRSSKEQDRVLRRIVEKRQAQMVHKKGGRAKDLSSSYLSTYCIRRSMKTIAHTRSAV